MGVDHEVIEGTAETVALPAPDVVSDDKAKRPNKVMDAAEYKHVVLGLIFLKYISDAFEAKHAELETQKSQGPDPPPLKWSVLRYVFDIKEDCNGKEAIQA